jgi:hypothetical protein
MTDQKTKELESLESMQQLIADLPEDRRHQVLVYAEDIRDILTEGQGDAFLSLTLVACEFSATNAQLDKEGKDNEQIIAG